jgi:hypothetical protein
VEVFNFPHHQVQHSYPKRNSQVDLGGGWTHTIKPNSPPARTFKLSFNAMKYFLDDDGLVSELIKPEINLLALEKFYQAHETYKAFEYEHYLHGVLVVMFSAPFETPKLLKEGNGVSQGFTLEFKEQPR